MKTDFDHVIDRSGTGSLKWERFAGRDVIPMWVADMDFSAPAPVLEAVRQRLEHGVLGYTLATNEDVSAVTDMLWQEYRWQVDPSAIVWLPGVVPGLNVACRMAGDPGDSVAVTTPIYPPFPQAPVNNGRVALEVPLASSGGRLALDVNALAEYAAPDTAMLLLCNPENPAGTVYRRSELESIAEFCLSHDMLICSDEIHCGLVLDENRHHIPVATINEEIERRTITLMAPSKTFNVPGLYCSFAIIPDRDLRRRFRQASAGLVPEVNVLGLRACRAAYRECGEWHEELLAYLRCNRDLVEEMVTEIPGVSMSHVEATYLAWIDCRSLGLDDPASHFEAAGVGLSAGRFFGAPGFVRLNFGCPRATLAEGLRRFRNATPL